MRRLPQLLVLAMTTSGTALADGQVPLGYPGTVQAAHAPAPDRHAPVDTAGRTELVLRSLNTGESQSFMAATDDGDFAASDLPRARHMLRETSTGHEFPLEPRLLDILYRIQIHFRAQEIRVISAYRTPVEGNGQGNHGRGRAVDFVVPGAADMDVARYAHKLGFVGVGLYPISSFVHVDVRSRSYFWEDRSGPGHSSIERGQFASVAARSDDAARARGERPIGEGENHDGQTEQ